MGYKYIATVFLLILWTQAKNEVRSNVCVLRTGIYLNTYSAHTMMRTRGRASTAVE